MTYVIVVLRKYLRWEMILINNLYDWYDLGDKYEENK